MATYQLVAAESSDPRRLLGLWVERDPDLDIAFPARAAADKQMATEQMAAEQVAETSWRVDLPVDPQRGEERLAKAVGHLHAAERALDGVPGRVRAVLDEPRRTSFAATGPDRLDRSDPDVELADWVMGAQEAAYNIDRDLIGANPRQWSLAAAHEVLDHVERACRPTLTVETVVEARVVARTRILLSGNMRTEILAAGHGSRHAEAVRVAVASRLTLLRALALAVRSATVIGASLILPGGPVLAIPAAWRFVHQVALLAAGREGPRHDRPTS
jgi:hypothetical protein